MPPATRKAGTGRSRDGPDCRRLLLIRKVVLFERCAFAVDPKITFVDLVEKANAGKE